MKKEKKIRVVIVESGKKPYEKVIENTLEKLQEIVDGYIEVVYPYDDNAVMVCNEEGKLIGLQPNRPLGEDVIAGTFIVAGDNYEGEFISLTDQQVEKYLRKYADVPENIENVAPKIELWSWFMK